MRQRRATWTLKAFQDGVMETSGLHGNQFMLIPPYLSAGSTINQSAQVEGLDGTTLARNLKCSERQLLAVTPQRPSRPLS
jgi:hypothetical protein